MIDKDTITPCFSLGNIEIDSFNNTIVIGTKEHSVEPRLIRIIVRLAQSNGEIVERSELLKEISERNIVSDESLTQAISKIRQLFEDPPKKPKYIKTVPRKGYLLLVPAVSIESSHMSQEQQEDVINKKESKSKLLTVLKTKNIVYGLMLLAFLIVISIAFFPKETTFIEKGEIEFIEKEG